MSDTEVLEKAIQKAIEGGWEPSLEMGSTKDKSRYLIKNQYHLRGILLSADFARALWGYGNNDKCIYCGVEMWLMHPQPCVFANLPAFTIKPLWQYHLQQMVVANDPLRYLADNI